MKPKQTLDATGHSSNVWENDQKSRDVREKHEYIKFSKLEFHGDNPRLHSNLYTQSHTVQQTQKSQNPMIQYHTCSYHTCSANNLTRRSPSKISRSTGPNQQEGPRSTPHNLANSPPQSKRPCGGGGKSVNPRIIALLSDNTVPPSGRGKGNNTPFVSWEISKIGLRLTHVKTRLNPYRKLIRSPPNYLVNKQYNIVHE